MTRIWVGTRKGLFSIEDGGSGWKIEGRGFLGVPVTMTLFDRRSESWFAGVKHGHFGTKLHRSSDGGRSWTELASPKFVHRSTRVAFRDYTASVIASNVGTRLMMSETVQSIPTPAPVASR